jgi:hypothetical protein
MRKRAATPGLSAAFPAQAGNQDPLQIQGASFDKLRMR